MTRTSLGLVATCLGLLAALPAFAQYYPGPYAQPVRPPPPGETYPMGYPDRSHHATGRSSLGVRLVGGVMQGEKLNFANVDERPFLSGLGVQIRNRLSPKVSLEVALDFLSGQSTPGAIALKAGENKTLPDSFSQSSVPLSVSLLWHPFGHAVLDPYVLGGLGLQWSSLNYADSVFETSLTEAFGQIGAGAQLWLGRRAALHADVRSLAVLQNFGATTDLIAECRSTAYCAGTDRVPKPEDKLNLGLQATAGVTFYW